MLSTVLSKFYVDYTANTPKKLKIIDAYLLYVLLTGIIQFVYCCLVGTFPFNSFLSGFISCVSCFVLAVCLRLQVNIFVQNLLNTLDLSLRRELPTIWKMSLLLLFFNVVWSLNEAFI